MVSMKTRSFLLAAVLFLSSCEKDIDIELDEREVSLVVDASIENGRPPVVILSRSLGYFNRIDPQVLAQSFVRDAVVHVSDPQSRARLKEDSITVAGGNRVRFYTVDAGSLPFFIGRTDTKYLLEIEAEGKKYTASTTIPPFKRTIDSLWWEPLRGPLEPGDSAKALLMLRGTDKPGLGSYIRYFTSVGRGPFLPGFNSVFDDQVIDGTTYTVTVDKGIDRNAGFEPDDTFFKRGDTVTLKLCDIDKATYDFWRTLEFSYQSVGNPFSNPVKVLGNVSGGALGSFSGYAAQFRTLVIPR